MNDSRQAVMITSHLIMPCTVKIVVPSSSDAVNFPLEAQVF